MRRHVEAGNPSAGAVNEIAGRCGSGFGPCSLNGINRRRFGAGAAAPGDMHIIRQSLPAAPGSQIAPLVESENQNERHCRSDFLTKRSDCVNGIRRSAAAEFGGADPKARLVFYCNA